MCWVRSTQPPLLLLPLLLLLLHNATLAHTSPSSSGMASQMAPSPLRIYVYNFSQFRRSFHLEQPGNVMGDNYKLESILPDLLLSSPYVSQPGPQPERWQ